MPTFHITITERELERMTRLGNIPWTKITDDEKEQYEREIKSLGLRLAYQILKNEGRVE